jgi:hypothetical protein
VELLLERPTHAPHVFDDRPALFEAACREGHEAKRLPYKPGQRGWLKLKNRNYRPFEHGLRSPAR